MDRPAFEAPASEWLVYGDALQEAGDPRGELIGLSHAVAEGRAEPRVRDAHVRKHWKALLGKCPPSTGAYDLDWHHCVLRAATVRVRSGEPDPVGPLLGAPAAGDLQSITLRGMTEKQGLDLAPHMQQLATRAPASCRSFAFVDDRATRAAMLVSSEFSPSPNLVAFGSIEPFWSRATEIALDVADGHQLTLGEIDAPDLRSFALHCLRFAGGGGAAMEQELAEARWPRLSSLELRLAETWIANIPLERDPYDAVYSARDDWDRYDEADDGDPVGVDWSLLVPVLQTLADCPLRRLALTSFTSSRSLLDALASAGLPPTLEELDLSDSALDDSDVEWLLSHGDRFRSLRRLVVECTSIGGAAAERLRALGPEILHSTGDAPRYRYVVGQE